MTNTLSLVITLLLLATTAHAGPALSLDQATRRVEQDSGARVLAAERRQRDGRPWYRFKLLTPKGRVRKVWVDPKRPGRQQ